VDSDHSYRRSGHPVRRRIAQQQRARQASQSPTPGPRVPSQSTTQQPPPGLSAFLQYPVPQHPTNPFYYPVTLPGTIPFIPPNVPPPVMPPQVSRMHPSHMSNPFVHLNSQNSIPQSSYQSHTSHLPGSFTSQPSFGGTTISPFPAAATYGASAFTPGASTSVFNGGTIGAQGQGQGLASVAAQQGFARGAAMQEHTAHQLEAASMDSKSGANSRIRQVWRHNLEQEMAVLRQLIIKYPYVSMVCCNSCSAETQ
jgi:hypothetical protein